MIWAIIRGRTVVYNAEIDMIKGAIIFRGEHGCMINCRIQYPLND